MKAIFIHNTAPSVISLGEFIFNHIKEDGYLNVSYKEKDAKSFEKFRKINLPDYFDVIENRVTTEKRLQTCLSMKFGRIKYEAFDNNCIIFGRICELYKIHKEMDKHGTNHDYRITCINYFDL